MDQIKLCGDCEGWKAWPGPRIGIDRYGTCMTRNKTTTRVTFCPLIDRGEDEPLKGRPLTKLQKRVWALYLLGVSVEQIGTIVGKTPAQVEDVLERARYKMTGEVPK